MMGKESIVGEKKKKKRKRNKIARSAQSTMMEKKK